MFCRLMIENSWICFNLFKIFSFSLARITFLASQIVADDATGRCDYSMPEGYYFSYYTCFIYVTNLTDENEIQYLP